MWEKYQNNFSLFQRQRNNNLSDVLSLVCYTCRRLLKNEWREKVSIVIIHSSLISETAFPRGLSLKVRLKWLWNNCPHHGQEENDKPTRSIAPLYTKMQQRNDFIPRYLITKFLNRWIRWTFAYHNSSKLLKCCLFHFFLLKIGVSH